MSLSDPLINPDDVIFELDVKGSNINDDGVASPTNFRLSEVMKSEVQVMQKEMNDKKPNAIFKDYINFLTENEVHCFETRNGERGVMIAIDMLTSLVGIGAWALSKTIYRFFKVRYLNYLYKFQKDGSIFFITFRKRFEKGSTSSTHKFSDFGITLSKLDVSDPKKCIGVPLKYDDDGRIKLGTVELLGRLNAIHEFYIKNELFSDVFNFSRAAQNMIITNKEVSTEHSLLPSINAAIQEIKKVNYDHFLRAAQAMRATTHKRFLFEHSKKSLTQSPPSEQVKNELKMKETELKNDEATATEYRSIAENYAGGGSAAAPAVAPAPEQNKGMSPTDFEKWLETNKEGISTDPSWSVGGRTLENGSYTRKNKYISRITSRKRRLYRKKSRKGKKVYKKLRSHKITKK